jgi:hypothetical protein
MTEQQSDTFFLVPNPGCMCKAPDGTVLPEEGAVVPATIFWRRRLLDGSCREGTEKDRRTAERAAKAAAAATPGEGSKRD